MKASAHREVVPVEGSFAAKMAGAMTRDCGPRVQIVVDMVLEAGMAKAQIEPVLRRDAQAMSADTAAAFRFADAVARRALEEDDCRRRFAPAGATRV